MENIFLYYVYILTTKRNTVLYTGVTNDLRRRCLEHREGRNPGFTKRYKVSKLVYYEIYDSIEMAIAREKRIKGLSREKKINLIGNFNPEWNKLFDNNKILRPEKNENQKKYVNGDTRFLTSFGMTSQFGE
jgi:putative endonuclease